MNRPVKTQPTAVTTKVIDNFGGRLTRYNYGDLNSGYAKYSSTFGVNVFQYPNQLTWFENGVQIDPNYSVITDLIMDGKERVEAGISYLYAIGHTGRLYKIQINDPVSYNPNYDNPVLLTTLTINSPTFTRGGSIEFFGSTERIYIGHDMGITRVDFDGTNESFVGIMGSWTQTVPRQLKQFIGKLYAANGNNIAEIDSTGTVTFYSKLSPEFPDNTQVRDLDQSNDGNYLQMTVSRLPLPDLTSATTDTTFLANTESYIFKWNGVDIGYTSFDSFPSFSLNANIMFGDYQYTFGYDLAGACVFNPTQKILTNILAQSPTPNAVDSNGNFVGWGVPEFYQGFLRAVVYVYGSLDNEFGVGFWRDFAQSAQGGETDVIRVPFQKLVSNFYLGSVVNGYQGGVVGVGKCYFSTLETSPAPTIKYKFYKFYPVPLGFTSATAGVYETQTEMFSKKMRVKEVRVYTNPLVANNGFQVDLIGPDGNVIANSTKTFTVGSTATVGDDRVWYDPSIQPTYAVAVRITNTGAVNHVINKIELDLIEGGE